MTELRADHPTVDRGSDGQMGGTKDWQAPALTVLGDARTLTEAGGVNIPDGGGNNMS